MSVAAFDRHGLGELRAEIGIWLKLTEKGFAQRLRIFLRFWVRLLDLRGATLDRVAGQLHWGFGGIGEKRYSLAEARAAPLFHVKVEVILVGIIGLWPENGAEFMTGFIVHMLHELGLRVRGRLRSDWGR